MQKSLLTATLPIVLILAFFSFLDHTVNFGYRSDNEIIPVKKTDDTIPAPPDTLPFLMVKDEFGKEGNLAMDELSIDVEVLGNIARTTMTMNFRNSTDRILEGELNFPLAENQTVTRFAMDVNGKIREGVVVEKDKGQKVFESIVRQNIDPGLLEKTSGNNFKARVYPIPANGNKRIIIAYENELISSNSGNLYLLPLQFKDPLAKFSIRIEVFKQKIKPVFEKNELTNLEFSAWNESYIAKQEFTNYLANKQLGFLIPETGNTYTSFVEKSDKQIHDDYFYVNLKPEKFVQKKNAPKSVCLLYDVSSSMAKKDAERELELLDAYFVNAKNVNVKLVAFSNEIHEEKDFSVKKGNWFDLREYLVNMTYDGATQFGCLDLSKFSCDEFLLFSDGLSNFGKNDIKLGTTPVMLVNSKQSADFSFLKFIASSTGGVFINLKNSTIEQAIQQLTSQNYHFISVEFDKSSVSEVYPSKPSDFTTNFSISGQLKSNAAEIKLNFGFANKIHRSVVVKIDKSGIIEGQNIIKRIWAQKKIAELDMLYEQNKAEIIELGKNYSIVTRNTSLIVLDRLEDYVQYNIVPPTELQKEYFEIVENLKKEEFKAESVHIEQVAEYFKARTEWWNTKFSTEKQASESVDGPQLDSIANAGVTIESVYESFSIVEDVGASELNLAKEEIDDDLSKNKEKDKDLRISKIQLNAWDPATPYMIRIKEEDESEQYKSYLELKPDYESTPAFYLDVANYFILKGKKKLALRVLSNIAELETENHELLRILAHRLEQLEFYPLAILTYEKVLTMRAEEPQSYRDLSLCLAADGQYQKALDIIYSAIKKPWDGRFPEIEAIMAIEMNRIISKAKGKIDISKIDKRLIKDMPVDVRIVLNWDTDNSDMDLWVTDPYKVKCFYSHPLTYTGGRMSRDFTGGYGPEEFMIKNALPGKYIVQANYYGSRSQRITGPTTIYLELFTNYGKPNEKKETITMQLSTEASVVDIGVLEFGN